MSHKPEQRAALENEAECAWRQLASELRQLEDRLPISLAQAERCYDDSEPMPLPPAWIQSIKSVVRGLLLAHAERSRSERLNDLVFTTQIWQPQTADTTRIDWVFETLKEPLGYSPMIGSVPREDYSRGTCRSIKPTNSHGTEIYEIWPNMDDPLPASARGSEPTQWNIYSDGSEWTCQQLAMAVDWTASSAALDVYRDRPWWDN